MAELHCCLCSAAFVPGRKNLAFLYQNGDVSFEPEDWIISVEMHGHLVGNMRWLKDGNTFNKWLSSDRPPETILDHVLKLPVDPTVKEKNGPDYRRRCVFATAKIVVSPIILYESGLLVEIDLPHDLLPTYRGRAMHINYYLTVTLERASICKRLHFPVPCLGKSNESTAYYTLSGGIVAYPPSALPEEIYLDSAFIEITADERETMDSSGSSHMKNSVSEKFLNAHPPIVYNVRDEGHICNISLPSLPCIPGTDEWVDFDFNNQDQACYAIKASIRLMETQFVRGKGGNAVVASVVQEKDVWTDYRLTTDTEFLRLYIYLPEESFCSFSCPLLKVEYKLILEFYLSPNSVDEPLSFAIDIEVQEQANLRRSRKLQQITESMSPSIAVDRKTQFLSMLHTCLEAKVSRVPFVEIEAA